ncbi:nicotinamide-nucleotide adenylyltransferase [Metallosphaera tengchongensis]|uniref:Nicotinamide-nucleotide adenylyltransferase n=1 Tax=Metallosphaera tengchongensis TaxID=1532350 RepID=A0A6N0NVT4_9CREN|nr:nicotinamide-nucleotide adenylyltransferase [Metallosphaera tengchongensis]QKR01014.1 nicotinamide-nucleotide adenylyltransferase [Metallosphaera tengchongensis]
MRRAIYPGRFQPFHLGHLSVVKWSLERVDELIILIGSAQESHTLSNPFTAGERVEMIRKAMNNEGIPGDRYYLIPIPDILMNNVWAYHVRMYVPSFQTVVARNPLVLRLFREAGNDILVPPSFQREKYNSTLIRKYIITGEEWSDLVPNEVYTFIKSIKGDERLREITGTDKR